MTITIKLKTDNAAFEADREGEIARIITQWAHDNMRFKSLYDVNGNKVGTVTVTGK